MARQPAAVLVSALARELLGAPFPLGLRCWDGSHVEGPAGSPTLVVRTPRVLRRFLYAPNEVGLARAYVSGELDVEGDLYAALSFPDALAARPQLRLDRRALAELLVPLAPQNARGAIPFLIASGLAVGFGVVAGGVY